MSRTWKVDLGDAINALLRRCRGIAPSGRIRSCVWHSIEPVRVTARASRGRHGHGRHNRPGGGIGVLFGGPGRGGVLLGWRGGVDGSRQLRALAPQTLDSIRKETSFSFRKHDMTERGRTLDLVPSGSLIHSYLKLLLFAEAPMSHAHRASYGSISDTYRSGIPSSGGIGAHYMGAGGSTYTGAGSGGSSGGPYQSAGSGHSERVRENSYSAYRYQTCCAGP